MGQDISKAYTPPPLSLRDCLVDGQINLAKYMVYKKRKKKKHNNYLEVFMKKNKRKRNDQSMSSKKKKICLRSIKRHPIMCRADDGSLREATCKDSTWFSLYLHSPPVGKRLLKIFRNRFRIPYDEFLILSDEILNHELFSRWSNKDACGNKPSDIRLLLLGTLRYIGRAHTFDDACESTYISAEVHRQFFMLFLEYGSEVLYNKYVINALDTTDTSAIEKIFRLAGFNGAMGSSDGTHIGMLCCPSWAFINHKGFKLAIPSRNYNATVTHWKQILGTTCGHPGTWNDKSIVLFDELIQGVHEGKLLADKEFQLFELNQEGIIEEITYQGAWFIVDNGYLNWATTVPPMKHPITYEEIRFSEWMESMRKDVECTFGILKGRFMVLKYGIRLNSISQCDKLWKTCCALHNKLLFIDGMDKGWDDSYDSDDDISDDEMEIPFSMERLNRHKDDANTIKTSKYDVNHFDKYTKNGKRVVRKMPLDLFQERLIHHFDIRFKRNDIIWPKRTKPNND